MTFSSSSALSSSLRLSRTLRAALASCRFRDFSSSSCLALLQGRLHPLAFRDVSGDPVDCDGLALLDDAPGIDFHPHGFACPRVGQELLRVGDEVRELFPEHVPHDRQILGVEELLQAYPVHLLGFVAVRAGGGGIAGQDLPLEIQEEDHVICVFEQFPELLLGLTQGFLDLSTFGDVRDDLDDPAERPPFIPHRVAAQDPVLLVRGDIDNVVGLAGLEGFFRGADAAGPAPACAAPGSSASR